MLIQWWGLIHRCFIIYAIDFFGVILAWKRRKMMVNKAWVFGTITFLLNQMMAANSFILSLSQFVYSCPWYHSWKVPLLWCFGFERPDFCTNGILFCQIYYFFGRGLWNPLSRTHMEASCMASWAVNGSGTCCQALKFQFCFKQQ